MEFLLMLSGASLLVIAFFYKEMYNTKFENKSFKPTPDYAVLYDMATFQYKKLDCETIYLINSNASLEKELSESKIDNQKHLTEIKRLELEISILVEDYKTLNCFVNDDLRVATVSPKEELSLPLKPIPKSEHIDYLNELINMSSNDNNNLHSKLKNIKNILTNAFENKRIVNKKLMNECGIEIDKAEKQE